MVAPMRVIVYYNKIKRNKNKRPILIIKTTMMKSISGSNLSTNESEELLELSSDSNAHLYIFVGCYAVAIIFLFLYMYLF